MTYYIDSMSSFITKDIPSTAAPVGKYEVGAFYTEIASVGKEA